MLRTRLAPILLVVALVALSGCAHRLSGPLHSADDPPFVAEDVARDLAEDARVPPFDVEHTHRVLLIGDAGYYMEDDPTLAALDEWARPAASSSVVFLGDNIYNEGLTDDDREHGERILAQQLAASAARKIVIPGNHDWGFMPRDQNAKAIRNQQDFVDAWPAGNAEFVPKDGCMGPVARVLREADASHRAIVLIAMDPTPWINDRLRAACPTETTREAVLARLESLLERYADQFVLLASHYPMLTGGPHGGLTYGFFADMIVTPLGWMMGGLGNTYEPDYADWIERTQAILRRHPPTLYAAGHDHSLQILDAGDVAGIYVVSGAGATRRVSTVTDLPETRFAHAAPGFVVVDFGIEPADEPVAKTGATPPAVREIVVLRVIEPGHPGPVFEMRLP